MSNFRKSFNFRNGVQVDDDNFVVNPNGLVGIGTSIPTEFLDVRGTAKVVGLATISNIYTSGIKVSGVGTFGTITDEKVIISSGIITASSGIVSYFGDGGGLKNIPTSQWVDVNPGAGFSSIYAAGTVGIATTMPGYFLQVGGNPDNADGVGINSTGNITATGILTASKFYGYGIGVTGINANYVVTGTIDNARLPTNINKPSGIITASSFVGTLTGAATSATQFTGVPDIIVGIVTANKIIADTIEVTAPSGITTVSKLLHVGTGGTALAALESGRLGIGSALPSAELQIIKESGSSLEVVAETGESKISIGQQTGVGNSIGVLRFGNTDKTLDIINRDTGNINTILHGGGSGIGTGRFDWIYGQTNSQLMSLTYGGKLGIGEINPNETLHVVGTSTVTGNAFIGGDLTVFGNVVGTLTLPSVFEGNINTLSGVSTFKDITAAIVSVGNRIGISSSIPSVGLDAQTQTALLGSVGVNTDSVYSNSVLSTYGNVIINGGLGINTDYFDPGGATFQIHAPLTEFLNSSIKTNATVGFDTSDPKAIFDFSNVGAATTRPVMVVPNIDDTVITGIAETPAGSIIFNTTTLKFQGYTGIAWTDFH